MFFVIFKISLLKCIFIKNVVNYGSIVGKMFNFLDEESKHFHESQVCFRRFGELQKFYPFEKRSPSRSTSLIKVKNITN